MHHKVHIVVPVLSYSIISTYAKTALRMITKPCHALGFAAVSGPSSNAKIAPALTQATVVAQEC